MEITYIYTRCTSSYNNCLGKGYWYLHYYKTTGTQIDKMDYIIQVITMNKCALLQDTHKQSPNIKRADVLGGQ